MSSNRYDDGSRRRPRAACEKLEDRRLLSAGGPSIGTNHIDGAAMQGRAMASITDALTKPGAPGTHTSSRGHLVARGHKVDARSHTLTGHFRASAGVVHRVPMRVSTSRPRSSGGAIAVASGVKAVSGTFTNGTMTGSTGTLFLDPALEPFGLNPPLNLVDIVNILGPVPDPSQIISPNTPGFAFPGGLLPFGGVIVPVDIGF